MYNKIICFKNLLTAYKKARRHKRYRKRLQEFEFNYEGRLLNLQKGLENRKYTPKRYHRFTVYEPKRREISAPAFVDRIVHHAIINIIESLFERIFISNSFACRKKKGTHYGVKTVKAAYRKIQSRNLKFYVLKCDIKNYFGSVDHKILLGFLRKQINCQDTFGLLQKIINSYQSAPGRGIPIGNLTSQIFANIYLHPLDIFVTKTLKEKMYFRYMDDFVILSADKEHLKDMRNKIKDFLEKNLKLQLHPKKVNIFRADFGLDFLGYTIYPNKTTLRKRTVRRYKKRHKRRLKKLRRFREELRRMRREIKKVQLSLFVERPPPEQKEELKRLQEKIEASEQKLIASANSFQGFLKYSKHTKLKGGGVLVSKMKIPKIFKKP